MKLRTAISLAMGAGTLPKHEMVLEASRPGHDIYVTDLTVTCSCGEYTAKVRMDAAHLAQYEFDEQVQSWFTRAGLQHNLDWMGDLEVTGLECLSTPSGAPAPNSNDKAKSSS